MEPVPGAVEPSDRGNPGRLRPVVPVLNLPRYSEPRLVLPLRRSNPRPALPTRLYSSLVLEV